jgi:hypothetical protein
MLCKRPRIRAQQTATCQTHFVKVVRGKDAAGLRCLLP